MDPLLKISAILVSAAMATAGLAAGADDIVKLDDNLAEIAGYRFGDSAGTLDEIEQLVFAVATDESMRAVVEGKLVSALNTARTRDLKIFLCRQLRTIGTERSIWVLEKMLADPEVSHATRYALGYMEGEASAKAMARSLSRIPMAQQIGVVNTLGLRRYEGAVEQIAALLKSPDATLAQAAARALGRIGNSNCIDALESARGAAVKDLAGQIDTALLRCAETLVAESQTIRAQGIYEAFYKSGRPMHLRLAGLRGLVVSKGPAGAAVLVAALKDEDAALRRGAISFMPLVIGDDATRTFAEMLGSLPDETKELMIRALGDRGDSAAAEAIAAETSSESENVRSAAAEALGKVGGSAAIVPLARVAAGSGSEKLVARASLVHLQGPGVDRSMLSMIGSGDPQIRAEVIHAVADRGTDAAVNQLLKAAADGDADVRREAIRALGKLADREQLPAMVKLAVAPADAGDLPAIEQAISAVFTRIDNPDDQAEPVLEAIRQAPDKAKPALLRLLNKPATEACLATIRRELRSLDADVRDAAVRSLADWPNAEPVEDLLAIAKDSDNRVHKVLALRGYVRLASMSPTPTQMYLRAMNLAARAEDKRLVLGGLGSSDSPQALMIVRAYLKDDDLKNEAAQAVVQIADRIRQNRPDEAKAALKQAIEAVDSSAVRDKAQAVINEMEQYDGYILAWMGAGPYTVKGKDRTALLEAAFAPENGDAGVEWKPIDKGIGKWDINLGSMFGDGDNRAIYARTVIYSPVGQDVRLELSSDDAIKAWLNGKVIHTKDVARGVGPRQDVVDEKLVKGANTLMLKIVNEGGGYGMAARVRKPDGTEVEGLRFEAE